MKLEPSDNLMALFFTWAVEEGIKAGSYQVINSLFQLVLYESFYRDIKRKRLLTCYSISMAISYLINLKIQEILAKLKNQPVHDGSLRELFLFLPL